MFRVAISKLFTRGKIQMTILKMKIMAKFHNKTKKHSKSEKNIFRVLKNCMSGLPYLLKGW